LSVGAVPKWIWVISSRGDRKTNRPTTASSTWVERSAIASTMLSRAASLMPKMLMTTRKTMTAMPPIELYGQVLRMGQNAAR